MSKAASINSRLLCRYYWRVPEEGGFVPSSAALLPPCALVSGLAEGEPEFMLPDSMPPLFVPELPPVPGEEVPAALGSVAGLPGAGVVAAESLEPGAVLSAPSAAAPAGGVLDESAELLLLSLDVLAGAVEGLDSIVLEVGEVSDSLAP